jgi:hypothetical protein
VGGVTAYVIQNRNMRYTRNTFALPHIEQLVNLENGCDYHVDPASRLVTAHRRFRRIKDDVVVGFAWGPSNVQQFGRQIDADQQINYLLATGDLGTIAQYAHDTASMDEIGPLEDVVQLGGVKDNNVLLAYAGAEVLVRKAGPITYGITPFPYVPGSGVPEPFVDYRPGDQIRVTARKPPRGNIVNQAVRTFGFSISADEEDNERLGQLQVAP